MALTYDFGAEARTNADFGTITAARNNAAQRHFAAI
jgi:hypothetical protein